jgi:formyltetrahydrofolate-dependent phosphoribosylglycinamide formyltransferase
MAPGSGSPRRFGVLISGRGSNMAALVRAAQAGEIAASPAVVIANLAGAGGLTVARNLGVPTAVVEQSPGGGRAAHDAQVVAILVEHGVELVCLAGYMRLLSPTCIDAFPGRILNIHPSLLPAFPGLHAQRQAIEHGAKISGCTVHFVRTEMDAGPIVAQAAVPVVDGDTADSLAARVLAAEHRLYPHALALVASGSVHVRGDCVLGGDDNRSQVALFSPPLGQTLPHS